MHSKYQLNLTSLTGTGTAIIICLASAAIITAFLGHPHYSRMSQKGREGSTTIFVTCDVLDSAITRIQDGIVNFAYRNSIRFPALGVMSALYQNLIDVRQNRTISSSDLASASSLLLEMNQVRSFYTAFFCPQKYPRLRSYFFFFQALTFDGSSRTIIKFVIYTKSGHHQK